MFEKSKSTKLIAKTLFIGVCLTLLSSWSCLAQPTVAVLGLEDRTPYELSPSLEEMSRELLSTLLVESESFTVTERARLEEIIEEQKLTLTGLFDVSGPSASLGQLLGAEYLLVGSLLSFDLNLESFTAYGSTYHTLDSEISGVIHLVNVTTGVIEGAKSFSGSQSESLGSEVAIDEFSVLQRLLRKSLRDVIPKLLPEEETESTQYGEVYVEIHSKPEGAKVFVDNIYVGRAPVSLTLSPDVHTFEVLLPGFRPWVREFPAFEGLRVNAVLELD